MKDHEHAGFSWYLTEKKDVFNPYNVSDRISRKMWYENITYPDLMRDKNLSKTPKVKNTITKKHIHKGPNPLFGSLSCQECIK